MMVSPEFDPYIEEADRDLAGIGCWNCDMGWRHGCCSDMCMNCTEAAWCDYARPCPLCNSSGDLIV